MRISEDRPKISVRNDFELVLFRWKYLNKTVNPSEEEIAKYNSVINTASRKIYSVFTKAFRRSGMDQEDVTSLARVHIVSYIGLFSIESSPSKLLDFQNSFEKANGYPPSQDDLDKKNSKIAYSFIYQRLLENALHCKRKVIREFKKEYINLYFLSTSKESVEKSKKLQTKSFLKRSVEIGFIEIDEVSALELANKNDAKIPNSGTVEFKDGSSIRVIRKTLLKQPASWDLSDRDTEENPEEAYLKKEEAFLDSLLKQKFDSMKPSSKRTLLKRFLKESENKGLEKERKEAYKMLKGLGSGE